MPCYTSILQKTALITSASLPLKLFYRHGHRLRGKPPGVARTLEQRLADENKVDPEIVRKINIGFPGIRPSRSTQLKERLAVIKSQRSNNELEKKARSHKLVIDLDLVNREHQHTSGQFHLRTIAEHFNVFQDLFGDAYFVPRVFLDIKYELKDGISCPVYNGNIIKPLESSKPPTVAFDGLSDPITKKKMNKDAFWTLLLTNPDGNFTSSDSEYVHWFVSNIPNGDVSKGDVLAEYLQPIPPKGIGFQRYIFILYKQDKQIDLSQYKVKNPNDLEQRTFKTLDFYRKYQESITPAGLAFFQSDWDASLPSFYHNVLNIKEPTFEYDFPKPYVQDQKWFPLKQPFNLYMDKHRDIKQINKEYLEKKLAKTHPFNGPEPELKYPNAQQILNTPSWLTTEMKKYRLKMGRINDYE